MYDAPYCFEEFSLASWPGRVSLAALAVVRDDETWSQLIPWLGGSAEAFALIRFHFPPDLDNSGFVGWLASQLKTRAGTSIFVVCGQNSTRGGIYDYWGCPLAVRDAVLTEIRRLRQHT